MKNIKHSKFSETETDELLTLHHTALQIRGEITNTPGQTDCSSVSKEDAVKVVPDSLFMFIGLLLTGEQDEIEDCHTKNIALSISQDIVYAVSKRKKLTPKHIGIGKALHQATRSKSLVEMVHQTGHCTSYDHVRRIQATLAKRKLERYVENGNVHVPIPSNLEANKFIQFAADNIDIIEKNLDGRGTLHATQMLAFQRGQFQNQHEPELVVGKDKSIKVPEECSKDCSYAT